MLERQSTSVPNTSKATTSISMTRNASRVPGPGDRACAPAGQEKAAGKATCQPRRSLGDVDADRPRGRERGDGACAPAAVPAALQHGSSARSGTGGLVRSALAPVLGRQLAELRVGA